MDGHPWVSFLGKGTKQSVLTNGTAQSVALTYFSMVGYEVLCVAEGGLH